MSVPVLTELIDPELGVRFDRGMELLVLFVEEPGVGSARVARARLLDLGEQLGFPEAVSEMIIDSAVDVGGPAAGGDLFTALAVGYERGDFDLHGPLLDQLAWLGRV